MRNEYMNILNRCRQLYAHIFGIDSHSNLRRVSELFLGEMLAGDLCNLRFQVAKCKHDSRSRIHFNFVVNVGIYEPLG